jgi:DNA-binding XRE family transcriptional regulator
VSRTQLRGWQFYVNYVMMSTTFLYEITHNMLEQASPASPRLAATSRSTQPQGMPTGEQIRAARALLRWSAAELARRARVSPTTVARCEAADGMPRVQIGTLERIRDAFEAAGVEFTQNAGTTGVRLRRQ